MQTCRIGVQIIFYRFFHNNYRIFSIFHNVPYSPQMPRFSYQFKLVRTRVLLTISITIVPSLFILLLKEEFEKFIFSTALKSFASRKVDWRILNRSRYQTCNHLIDFSSIFSFFYYHCLWHLGQFSCFTWNILFKGWIFSSPKNKFHVRRKLYHDKNMPLMEGILWNPTFIVVSLFGFTFYVRSRRLWKAMSLELE